MKKTHLIICVILAMILAACTTRQAHNSSNTQPQLYSKTFDSAALVEVMLYYGKLSERKVLIAQNIPDVEITLQGKSLTKDEMLNAIKTALKIHGIDVRFLGDEMVMASLLGNNQIKPNHNLHSIADSARSE